MNIYKSYSKDDKLLTGFTLIEVVIAITIFTVLLFAVTNLLLSVFSNPKQYQFSLDNIDEARMIANNFANELRNAATANDGSFCINQTNDSQIIFYSSRGSSGTNVNRIRYYVAGNTLYKGIIVPSGSPLTYNPAIETVTTLINNLANGTTPVFYYYDGNYDATTNPLSAPINANQVKFVKINLIIPKLAAASSANNFSISAGAAIRSLKNNLGN